MNTATSELEPLQTNNLLDRDIQLDLGMDSHPDPSAVVMTARGWQTVAEPAAPVPPSPHTRARSRLLSMADGYLRSGSLRQALEMYFDLMDGYPGTTEAEQAEEQTLEVASRHEQAGELHLARAIYERLA